MNDEVLNSRELVGIFFRYLKVILAVFLLGISSIVIFVLSFPSKYQAEVPLVVKGYVDEGLAQYFQARLDETAQDPEFRKWVAQELEVLPENLGAGFLKLNFNRNSGKVVFVLVGLEKSLLQEKAVSIAEQFAQRFPDKLKYWTDRILESQLERKNVFRNIYESKVGVETLNLKIRKLNLVRNKRGGVGDKLYTYMKNLWRAESELIQIRGGIKDAEDFFNVGVSRGPLNGVSRFNSLNPSTKSAIEKKVYMDLAREISSSRLEEKKKVKLIAFYKAEIEGLEKELSHYQKEEAALGDKIDKMRELQRIVEEKTDVMEKRIFDFKEFKQIRIEVTPAGGTQVNEQNDNKWAAGAGMAVLLLMAIVFLVYFWELLLKPWWSGNR